MTAKSIALAVLKRVRDEENLRDPVTGICAAISCPLYHEDSIYDSDKANAAFIEIKYLMGKWPKGTGNSRYPVPAPYSKSVENASDSYYQCMDCWNQETTYGQSRWELLHWLIEQLETL